MAVAVYCYGGKHQKNLDRISNPDSCDRAGPRKRTFRVRGFLPPPRASCTGRPSRVNSYGSIGKLLRICSYPPARACHAATHSRVRLAFDRAKKEAPSRRERSNPTLGACHVTFGTSDARGSWLDHVIRLQGWIGWDWLVAFFAAAHRNVKRRTRIGAVGGPREVVGNVRSTERSLVRLPGTVRDRGCSTGIEPMVSSHSAWAEEAVSDGRPETPIRCRRRGPLRGARRRSWGGALLDAAAAPSGQTCKQRGYARRRHL